MVDVEDVIAKYSERIKTQMREYERESVSGESISQDYQSFKRDMMPDLSRYERWAKSLGNFIKIKLSEKDSVRIQEQLRIAHLEVSPGEVVGLAIMSFLGIFILGIILGIAGWFIAGGPGVADFPFLFLGLIMLTGAFLFYYFYSMPDRMAVRWKLKTSSQMVPAVLYTVIYMKHTSNLERAISFVSKHIEPPLSLDLRKVIWDVETGMFSSIKESLDSYLDFWKDSNIEFVESFHLIESSLYEPSDARRIQILERALRVILDGVYERMLKYTQSIKAPLTNLYMLGIVLPTLGLAMLPLASTLLGGLLRWTHIFILFNMVVPFFVFYLTLQVMLKRPGGYGETSLLENNPFYYKYVSKKPYYIAAAISAPFFIIGLLPLLFGFTPVPGWVGLNSDYVLADLGLGIFGRGNLFDFQINDTGNTVGPFGVFALLLSMFIPLSIILFFYISFTMKTKELIVARNDTKALENEFNSTLFALGNRLGDGTPAEIAFSKIAQQTRGQKTEEFFRIVNTNIQSMGMGLEDAIFDSRRGALVYFPSNLIATSMRILIESVKKGLHVAAESLMSISEYVRNMHKIDERLKDLLAEVISDMKSNMTFLAPLLSGIVVGLSAMITGILAQLKTLSDLGGGATVAGLGTISNITELFNVVNMIPPYHMQIAISVYIIQVIFILTATLVTINSGSDRLQQTNEVGKNLLRGGILYLITAVGSTLALSILAGVALGSLVG
jgi:hypothetical protein